VQTVVRHVALVDAYRSQARATLVGVAALVARTAVDGHAAGWDGRGGLSVAVVSRTAAAAHHVA